MAALPAPQYEPPTERIRIVQIAADDDSMLAFNAEKEVARPLIRIRRHSVIWIPMAMLLLAGVLTAGYFVFKDSVLAGPSRPTTPVVVEGVATISSRPEGAQVLIDGATRGVTPLRLSLPVGQHTLELRNGSATRSLPIVIEAGTVASQYVDLDPVAASSAALGRLEISSDPPGARISVDGISRGVTPLALASIVPGQRRVVLTSGESTFVRTVTVTPGATSTVVASLRPAGPAAGWVVIQSVLELQVLENGSRIGTTSIDRLMLPAGTHQLELVNKEFGFRTTTTVLVTAGGTATAKISLPSGRISINAVPWAEVFIDGNSVGTTPLANLSVTIGPHEIVWQHPQLGRRAQTVSVTTQQPVRVGMDFNR